MSSGFRRVERSPNVMAQDVGPTEKSEQLREPQSEAAVRRAVPEQKTPSELIFEFAERWGAIVGVCIAISTGVWAFYRHDYILDQVKEDVSESEVSIKRAESQIGDIDKRLVVAEKEVEYLGRTSDKFEGEIDGLKRSASELEKVQAVISDRTNRSAQKNTAGE